MRTVSIREVAKAAGRSASGAALWARAGLLPGYTGVASSEEGQSVYGRGAQVPVDLAEAYVLVLRSGVASARLAELMRESPADVLAAADALALLARTAMESGTASGKAA
jgi:hypothetical protein